ITASGMFLPVTNGFDLRPAPSATLKFHLPTATHSLDVPLQSSSVLAACACARPARIARSHLNDFAYIELLACPALSLPIAACIVAEYARAHCRRFVAVCNQL